MMLLMLKQPTTNPPPKVLFLGLKCRRLVIPFKLQRNLAAKYDWNVEPDLFYM